MPLCSIICVDVLIHFAHVYQVYTQLIFKLIHCHMCCSYRMSVYWDTNFVNVLEISVMTLYNTTFTRNVTVTVLPDFVITAKSSLLDQ